MNAPKMTRYALRFNSFRKACAVTLLRSNDSVIRIEIVPLTPMNKDIGNNVIPVSNADNVKVSRYFSRAGAINKRVIIKIQ